MCGIAAVIDWAEPELAVRRLINGLVHRGDITDPVVAPVKRAAMCTRRLRIVDAENAIQPQISFDGRVYVAFNGEIYNHHALRMELERRGIAFKTQSDTEVVANALRIWGHNALARLSGMFAFVAIDLLDGSFLAARDPFGVKPLYVIQAESGFLFCSEIRPLLDTVARGDVLLLPPGYVLTKNICAPYYKLPPSDAGARRAPLDLRELDRLLRQAVLNRLPEELPCAIMFSGGIDSTLVANYARQQIAGIPGYFVGLPDAPDFAYAEAYAAMTGFDMRSIAFDPNGQDARKLIPEVTVACESFEPNVVRGAICSYVVARRMHEDGFRVALCGEGADELFCGYQAHELAFAEGEAAGFTVREECLELMHRTSLQRVDRCSMRFQLETREPFLDRALADYALHLDQGSLVGEAPNFVSKKALRALYDLYPAELPAMIRDRRKVPLDEGAGLDVGRPSGWDEYFEQAVSERDFEEAKKAYAPFNLQTKEECFYLLQLAQNIDVSRVPHLKGRAWLNHSFRQ